MKILLSVFLTLTIMLCASSCAKNGEDKDEAITTAADTSAPMTETEENSADQFYVSDAEIYEIDTPYGAIYYPTLWKDIVVTEVDENADSYKIRFSAALDDTVAPLYTVIFGEYDGGYMVAGTIEPNKNEYVRVYFEDLSAEGLDMIVTEESRETYLMMCEDVNIIISNLIYKSGMELD